MKLEEKRKLVNLKYRMRKAGYTFNDTMMVVILPDKGRKRSLVREKKIIQFHYDLQKNIFDTNENYS
jgi:hypothetical protein